VSTNKSKNASLTFKFVCRLHQLVDNFFGFQLLTIAGCSTVVLCFVSFTAATVIFTILSIQSLFSVSFFSFRR